MTGQSMYPIQPGELGGGGGYYGGGLGAKLAEQAADIGMGIPGQPIGARGGIVPYAGGGVVGTTATGFTPSGPVGGAPISAGAPSFTSGMAGGGPVAPTTGGFVSQALSPSNGHQVDDVPARLNEGEYVIPRDVVQFKGKEFFHKLIAQSRKNRETHQRSMFGGGGVQSYG